MAERPGVGFDPRQIGAVGMAVEARFGLQIGVEFGLGKEARARERAIERAGAVALAHHEAVAIRGLGVGWIDSKNIEIESRDAVRRRKIAPLMPLPRAAVPPQDRKSLG